MGNMVNGEQSAFFQQPHGTGKTTAIVVGMLNRINESDNHLQAIFIAGNEISALNAYALAESFTQNVDIEMGLSTNDTLLEPNQYHVIFGTLNEMVIQVQEANIDMTALKYIYVDDANKVLTYNKFWNFVKNVPQKLTFVATCEWIKRETFFQMKDAFDGIKILSTPRTALLGIHIKIAKIICNDMEEKITALKKILTSNNDIQALVTVNVNIIY